jgi:hypothetical protein
MNKALLLVLPGLVMAGGCGPKQVALSTDPVERAATCGVVAAANARVKTTDIKAPLSLDAKGETLRYALLTGAQEDVFSADQAGAVVNRMAQIADKVIEGNWKKLVAPCAEAYPAVTGKPELPKDPLEAGMGCDMMRQFVGRALASDGRYEDTLVKYSALERALDTKLAPLMSRNGVDDGAESMERKRKAMSTLAKSGNPTQVMEACVQRYT